MLLVEYECLKRSSSSGSIVCQKAIHIKVQVRSVAIRKRKDIWTPGRGCAIQAIVVVVDRHG